MNSQPLVETSDNPPPGSVEQEPGPGLLHKTSAALDTIADSISECIIEGLADHVHATCSFQHPRKPDDT